MRIRLVRVVAMVVATAASAAVVVLSSGDGLSRSGHGAGADEGLRLIPMDRPAFVPPPESARFTTRAATFTVNYSGFTAPAQAALQFAVDIWSGLLTSPEPVVVDASFATLASGILGSAGATSLRRGVPNDPFANTWYPVAVANKLAGTDLDPARSDITASFSDAVTWYFGTDGQPPSGTVDFVTVVLHEIGHGLGFFGSATIGGGGFGTWGVGTGKPDAFDRFVQNGSSQYLIDQTLFPNPSAELAGLLTGGDLFFGSPALASLTTGRAVTPPARMYAPAAFEAGSSYSHLDETTFPAGDSNSLMTPKVAFMEAIHDPGTITREVLREIGWTVSAGAPPSPADFPTAPTDLAAAISGLDVTLTWNAGAALFSPPSRAASTAFSLEARSASGLTDVLVEALGNVTTFSAQGVPGTYFVAVRGVNAAGQGPRSNEITVQLPGGGAPPCGVVPDPPTGVTVTVSGGTVTLNWTASTGCPATSYLVAAGSTPGADDRASFDTGSALPTLAVMGVSSGTYFVRVHGRGAAGTGGPSPEITVVVP